MTPRLARYGAIARDVLIVTAVALVTFQALRRFGGDYYRVPSGSMEPFLYGDRDQGDVVFVDAWSTGTACGRDDVVVVRHPEEPGGQLVKRIAASGDDKAACWINLMDGDIWRGPDANRVEREVKDPRAARKMSVTWARWPSPHKPITGLELAAAREVADCLVVPAIAADASAMRVLCRGRAVERQRKGSPPPAGFLGTDRAVDAAYVDAAGGRGREGEDVEVNDCGMAVQLSGSVDTLVAILETRVETITFLWSPASGRLELWRDGEDVETTTLPMPTRDGHRIEFGRLDDQLFFLVDGRDDAMFCRPRRTEWNTGDPSLPAGPRSRLFVAALGSAALTVSSLEVFRDLYHFRERILGLPGQPSTWPMFVAPGHWFLLGDNAFDSRDSRSFGTVPASSYLGRPRLVLGPWPRSRWLHP